MGWLSEGPCENMRGLCPSVRMCAGSMRVPVYVWDSLNDSWGPFCYVSHTLWAVQHSVRYAMLSLISTHLITAGGNFARNCSLDTGPDSAAPDSKSCHDRTLLPPLPPLPPGRATGPRASR